MLRIGVLVMAMALIMHAPESSLYAYKDYIVGVLLSVLIKPWLWNQFD